MNDQKSETKPTTPANPKASAELCSKDLLACPFCGSNKFDEPHDSNTLPAAAVIAGAAPCSAHRDFLAFLLYASESGRRGEIPCRWGTLRDDLKEKWLNTADTKMNEWLASEES